MNARAICGRTVNPPIITNRNGLNEFRPIDNAQVFSAPQQQPLRPSDEELARFYHHALATLRYLFFSAGCSDHLIRLRERGVGGKRNLAIREFALGHEALKRFVAREPLRRVHECVFGVLALKVSQSTRDFSVELIGRAGETEMG